MTYPKSIFKQDEVSPEEMFCYYYSNRSDATKAYRNIIENDDDIPDDVLKQRAFRYLRSDGVRNIMAKNADYEFSDKANVREAMLDRLIHFANNANSEKVASDSAKAVVEILSKSKKVEVDVSHALETESAQLLDDIRGALLSGVQDVEVITEVEPIRYKHMIRIPQYFEIKKATGFRCHEVLSEYEPQDWNDEEVEEEPYVELL